MKPKSSYLLHYTTHLFFDVYPLSEVAYKENSLKRRASNDYAIQIVEQSHNSLGWILTRLGLKPENYKRHRFYQAQQEQILPKSITETLVRLISTRNKTVHENVSVTEDLTLYSVLIEYVAVGYAMFHLISHCEFCLTGFERAATPEDLIIIDRAYLFEELERNIKDNEVLVQIKTKLSHDDLVPAFTINLRQITNRVLEN